MEPVAKHTVGFVGVGRMGRRMARRVMEAGFVVNVFDLSTEAMTNSVAAGAQPAATAAGLAAKSDVVIIVLPDAAAVEAAIVGDDGVVAGIRPGTVVVEMSTISPSVAHRLAQAIEERGAHYLDCPVSGGIASAEKGALTLLVGGKAEVLEMCRRVLEPMAAAIFHLGDVGAGLTAKLVNQLLTMTQTVLVVEALAVGARAGIDLTTLYELITKSSGNSWCWENRIPRILKEPGDIRVTLDICHKDLGLAKALGEELGVPLFVATGAFQVLQMAKSMRLGEQDVSALARMYERMLGVQMRAQGEL
jgi:3-hydroxyisobutyrate dehydrogenase-like beta-hydroxyacid dehydrogenase